MKQELFDIHGMSCAACATRVEKRVASLSGVSEASVNLLTNSMRLCYDETQLQPADISAAVKAIGYVASAKESTRATLRTDETASPPAQERRQKRAQLFLALGFTLPLFYLSMGHMLGLPLPSVFLGEAGVGVFALTQFLLLLPVLFAGRAYFKNGLLSLWRRAPNMDSLIALGSGAALLYGLFTLYHITYLLGIGATTQAHHAAMNLYFESAAMILTLVMLGKFLESRAKDRTSDALAGLMNLTPPVATVLRGGEPLILPTESLVLGDILLVKAGEAIPADGLLVEGAAAVDESAISGESLPVEKQPGDSLVGGTLSRNGYFQMRVTALGEETMLARMIRLVEEATAGKAPIARLADKISGIFVPIVLLLALLTAGIWLFVGAEPAFALRTAICVLVISCPCALGLATPTAIMVGTGAGARSGILIKSAEILERAHSIDTVVLDKTGTVTAGKPCVTGLYPLAATEEELLGLAASLEQQSGHPLAEPIVEAARARGLSLSSAADYRLLPGEGLEGRLDGILCHAGNRRLLRRIGLPDSLAADLEETLSSGGNTPLFFVQDSTLLGLIAVSDPIKPSSPQAVARLQAMGVDVLLLTGDHKGTAEAIGRQLGLRHTLAELRPEEKELEIRKLQANGHKVAMVGDGINDAPALARADVGIAIGAGTEIAIDSADIVLTRSDLLDVPAALSLSRAVLRSIKQNLFWAFLYNAIGIPIAAGVLYPRFGILLSPMLAAAAMSFSSLSVVLNALRLRYALPQRDRGTTSLTQEERTIVMKRTLHIEDMSCQHCVRSVETALQAVEGVRSVSVSLEEKQATVTVQKPDTDDILRAAVEGAGYRVTGIE